MLTGSAPDRPNWPPVGWAESKGLGGLATIVDDSDGTISRAWGLTSFPYVVGVDAEHKVVFRAAGEQAEGFFAGALRQLGASAGGEPAAGSDTTTPAAPESSSAALAPAVVPAVMVVARRTTTTPRRSTTRPTTTRPPTTRSATTRPATTRPATTRPATTRSATAAPVRARVQVVRTLPHDASSFTQGFEVHGDTLYESSGLYGSSSIRTVSLTTGQVLRKVELPDELFAEGLTVVPGNRVIQLTWREKTAIVRDATTLEQVGTFRYEEEGWGLCWSEAARLVVHSDGTGVLRLRDPSTFAVVATVTARQSDGTSPTRLNELECVADDVYANVWLTDQILQIDLTTGRVERIIDASSIRPAGVSTDDVLNGIARLPNGNFLLTGKNWPLAFEVTFVDV